jgi:hypothetical protein
MFGSRATVQEALDYCESLINTLAQTDQVGIRVGLGVLLNTIDNVVTQSQAPKPINDQADLLIQLSGMYDKLVSDVADKVAARSKEDLGNAIDEHIHNLDDKIDDWMKHNLRDKVMDIVSDDNIDDQISNWMSNNFDLDDYNVDGAIESWMDNNIDDKVYDAVNSISFTVEIGR